MAELRFWTIVVLIMALIASIQPAKPEKNDETVLIYLPPGGNSFADVTFRTYRACYTVQEQLKVILQKRFTAEGRTNVPELLESRFMCVSK